MRLNKTESVILKYFAVSLLSKDLFFFQNLSMPLKFSIKLLLDIHVPY